jgi:hypothetical protein
MINYFQSIKINIGDTRTIMTIQMINNLNTFTLLRLILSATSEATEHISANVTFSTFNFGLRFDEKIRLNQLQIFNRNKPFF